MSKNAFTAHWVVRQVVKLPRTWISFIENFYANTSAKIFKAGAAENPANKTCLRGNHPSGTIALISYASAQSCYRG